VSLAIIVLRHTKCPFAVKSGGHGKFYGESSISDGVALDLAFLNHVEIVDMQENKVVQLGPGNRWFEVYSALEPLGLTVVGGRSATVGVGGFLLGGRRFWTGFADMLAN
jgi:FAD/FMN-containing dehydrogenase